MTTTSYISNDEFRAAIKDETSLDDSVVTAAISAASRRVDGICGRSFYQQQATQYFSPEPNNSYILSLGDMGLATTTGLTVNVQWANGANYPEVRTFGTHFDCQPVNQSVDGLEGWPFTSLRSFTLLWPPRIADYYQDTVKVVGTWGWPAVPAVVKQATTVLAVEMFKQPSDAPFGVSGFDTFGAIRMRDNPLVVAMLHPLKAADTLMMA